MNAHGVLAWLERFGRRVEFQPLTPSRRRKNRVLLQYAAGPVNETAVVGASTLSGAVEKAVIRERVRQGRVEATYYDEPR